MRINRNRRPPPRRVTYNRTPNKPNSKCQGRKVIYVAVFLGLILIVMLDFSDKISEDFSTNLLSDMMKVDVAGTESSTKPTISKVLLGKGANERQVIDVASVWRDLITEAHYLKASHKSKKAPGIIMEIGMHDPFNCKLAAHAGLEAHCVEASAVNFANVESRTSKFSKDIQENIHLYNVVAGSATGRPREFYNGESGERTGLVDVWNMEKPSSVPPPGATSSSITKVQEMRMDDIVLKNPEGAFLIKIDTHGFEPRVLAGLSHSLRSRKAKFILFEYWPKGIDLMTSDNMGDCKSIKMLLQLVQAGYKLYQLPVKAHPKAPSVFFGYEGIFPSQPLDDLERNCRWYYDLENEFPSKEYKMGYWSHILAVAPDAQIKTPKTVVGKQLFP